MARPTVPGTLKVAPLVESVPATGAVPPAASCTTSEAEATPLPVSAIDAVTVREPWRAIHGPPSQSMVICGGVLSPTSVIEAVVQAPSSAEPARRAMA